MDSVTPDEPRRAPIRWHVATVRDARTESPTARTLVLDGVFDLAALEDLAVGRHGVIKKGRFAGNFQWAGQDSNL